MIAEIEFQLFSVRVIFTNPQNNWFILTPSDTTSTQNTNTESRIKAADCL